MTLEQLLDVLRTDSDFKKNIAVWRTLPSREPVYADFPPGLDRRLTDALAKRGVKQLYSHQAEAVHAAMNNEDLVVVTPTASGKTLCYTIPVLQRILKDPNARALYLFPTKALKTRFKRQ